MNDGVSRVVEVNRRRLVVMEDVYRYDLNKFLKARDFKAFTGGAAVRPANPVRGLWGE